MKSKWVLVADSVSARIFAVEDELKLVQVEELSHPESRLHNQDMMGNRPGELQHSMEKALKGDEPQSLRDHESLVFAKEVARFLQTAYAQNRFGELIMVADPRFLGMLRGNLDKPVMAAVTGTLDKRAVGLRAEEVAELVGL